VHKILERQLKRLSIAPGHGINDDEWQEFLNLIDRVYAQADQDRYLLERSLAISSKEMQALYEKQERESSRALKLSEGRYRSLFENAHDSIFIIDAQTRQIVDANHIAATRLGYSDEELRKLSIEQINTPEEAEENALIFDQIRQFGTLTFERTHVRRDGSHMPVEISSAYLEVDGRGILQSLVRDITDRKIAEARLKDLASHDSLTHLRNRGFFDDRMMHAIQIAKRRHEKLAVLFIDLDKFKAINDAFGHKVGDHLLVNISERLKSSVRESDTVGRFGGDEFVILLEGIDSDEDVLLIAKKISENIAKSYKLEGADVFVTASIGISMYPKDGQTPDQLIQNADRAMYLGKNNGEKPFEFFNAKMKTRALEKLEISNQIRIAMQEDKFTLHYQPQVDSKTGRVYSVEALIRLNQANGILSDPGHFLPIAEETGLILEMGEWVLETACMQMMSWLNKGIAPDWVSVNLSDRDLNRPDFIAMLEGVLHRTQIPPENLELELTENIIFRDMEKTRLTLGKVKELGVRLAIDDFGTGYSTLQHLADFPFDTLKIDRHYAHRLSRSSKDAAVVSGIIMIARNLGLNVVGEGIENEEQLSFYESQDCHHIQGWLFSKALNADGIEELLSNGGIRRPQLKLALAA
jgi:diguanylate cyclase (GGDEF)-like protein/PAS domain S-box-containing protein